ncbi:unnamed protein product [Vitrella brassicaformis CCMP3155]|uniref:J domain-containing protein n=1 Tax=Vitrella brassicaformis (strain CCMP3155) TaxID=1169540 RepID=A0A0G4EDS3_VITBC|nr:unnamed protein product [Vitrella brassicaformis CCMP3155]|eukprot:CEL94090.1 unnamed protein product [Vitrella brassicaformis CCMP3155]
MENLYDRLGVSRDATATEIKKSFRQLALRHHPDKGGDVELFKNINIAWEVLGDDDKRSDYDKKLIRLRSMDGLRSGRRDYNGGDSQTGVRLVRRATTFEHGKEAPQRTDAGAAKDAQEPKQGANLFTRRASDANAKTASTNGDGTSQKKAPGAFEIPSDPSSLTVKELKDLLSHLGIIHDDCIERGDLLERLRSRRDFAASKRPAAPKMPETSPQSYSSKAGRPLRIKVISLGAEETGKSCLIKRFCEGRFVNRYISTYGIDYGVKEVQIGSHNIKINFWDLSGHDDFYDIRNEFFDHVQGVLLVFDVTNRQSFERLNGWLQEAKRHSLQLSRASSSRGPPFVVLIGNKVDRGGRVVAQSEGAGFAASHGMDYYETSANTGYNVQEALMALFKKAVDQLLSQRHRFGIANV